MKDEENSGVAAEVIRKYIPELPAGESWDRLHDKLSETAGRVDVVLETHEVPPPPPYQAVLDPEGRLRDYFRHFATTWSGPLQAALEESPAVAPENTVYDDFLHRQTELVSALMMRTLLEELHRRRDCGLLRGDTPQARYKDFRRWTNSEAGSAELAARYPHLLRTVRDRARAAERYLLHVVSEFDRHRERVSQEIPGLGGSPQIIRILLGAGDAHHDGRTVAQILLAGGGRLLYKPHPLESEAGYQAFVKWINDRVGTRLRVIRAVPCGAGGFVEHVRTEDSSGDAAEYFAKIGQLAGVLYLLRATDIHYENVITGAGGPVVVDTETLLTPRLRGKSEAESLSPAQLGARALQESVAGIGILPMVVGSGDDGRGLDIGAIGYDPGQQVPHRTLRLHNRGRDDMYVQLAKVKATGVNPNLSVRQAAGIPVRDQRDLIKSQFARVLDFARTHPDDVIGAISGLLGDATFRYVNNPTIFYSQLLRMGTHPTAQRDPLIRSAVLQRVVLGTGDAPEIADAEVQQLARGDVPYFCYSAHSADLFELSEPTERHGRKEHLVSADAFEESPLATVCSRIEGLDQQVIDRESELVDLAFVGKLPQDQESTGFDPRRTGRTGPAVSRTRLLEEAVRIGDELVGGLIDSREARHPATWIAPQVMTSEQSQWSPGTTGYDLYGGSPGLALALAGLGRETGRSRYRDAAMRVLGPMEEQLESGALEGPKISVGGMTGLAGTVYAITTARRLLGGAGCMSAGELAAELARRSEPDVGCDFLSGMAGTLAVTLVLRRDAQGDEDREQVDEAARTVAAALMKGLRNETSANGQVTPYTGFSHGAMGIAPVLLEFASLFGHPEAHDLGRQYIAAVLDAYDETDRDWPRFWSGPERSHGWCHGAPGILLGGLTALRHAPDAIPADRVARLAELTWDRGFGNNPTYCHGDLATVEIVETADREMPGLFPPAADGLYPRLFDDVIERYTERADTKYGYSSSLLVGRSGFLWSILRHLDPTACPSVLRLE